MHRIFGQKRSVEYTHRKGAYLIPIENGKVAVAQTPKGYFLLGGGLEPNETEEGCMLRECLEETGWEAKMGELVCSAETYGYHFSNHPQIEFFHPMQTYYLGKLIKQTQQPTEMDCRLAWIDYAVLRGNLFVEMQNWALEKCWDRHCGVEGEA